MYIYIVYHIIYITINTYAFICKCFFLYTIQQETLSNEHDNEECHANERKKCDRVPSPTGMEMPRDIIKHVRFLTTKGGFP